MKDMMTRRYRKTTHLSRATHRSARQLPETVANPTAGRAANIKARLRIMKRLCHRQCPKHHVPTQSPCNGRLRRWTAASTGNGAAIGQEHNTTVQLNMQTWMKMQRIWTVRNSMSSNPWSPGEDAPAQRKHERK